MSDLEEIEAIKQLKYRYIRGVDLKRWDLLASTFAADATSGYDSGKNAYEGRDAIVGWLRDAMEGNLITLHQVHHPEIEITGEATARGTWYLEDRVINPGPDRPLMPGNSILSGAGFYSDEYVKQDGEWKIQHTGYERTYVELREREPGGSLTSRWEVAA